MKKIFHSIMLAAMVLSTVACSQEELTSSYFSDAKAVKISAQIGTSDVTGSFQTRSTPWGNSDNETSKFNIGDKIAVSSSSQDPAVYQLQTNGTWLPVSKQYLVWEKKEKTVFKAYYPAKDGVSAETFQQPTNFSKNEDMSSADYMTFEGEFNNNNNNPVSLKMERKMARLLIQIESLDFTITSVQIHSNVSGYANGTIQRQNTDITTTVQDEKGYFRALLVPTYKDDNETFLSLEGYLLNITKTFTAKGIPELKAGYSYTLKVTIN